MDETRKWGATMVMRKCDVLLLKSIIGLSHTHDDRPRQSLDSRLATRDSVMGADSPLNFFEGCG